VSPERLQQIETLYNDALALQPRERTAFLDGACGNDGDLRREIESLLAYEQQAETYMDRSAIQIVAASLAEQRAGVLVDRMLGRYQLLSLAGQGGMAEVYCAVDSRLNRLVAVKVLSKYMAEDRERLQRFEQEARAVAVLNHPHICTLHDVGTNGGMHYLVFEYLVGELLSDRLSRGSLPLLEALDYATQIADALVHAHEQGIIHLDLKPQNIMLTRTGVKLLDFGIAELRYPNASKPNEVSLKTNAIDPSRTTPGTRGYMAPEQIEGRETDARTDIFGFGVVLYEMLTGRFAFPGRSPTATTFSALSDDPPPASQVQPEVPPALDFLIARCLARHPSERWQSISELLSNVREIRSAFLEKS
jgi:eukaryotic-like serine/threonine-protein kinase